MLRIDAVELSDVGGLRFNVWTSIVLFVLATVCFVVSARLRPGREQQVYRHSDPDQGPDQVDEQPAPGSPGGNL